MRKKEVKKWRMEKQKTRVGYGKLGEQVKKVILKIKIQKSKLRSPPY